MGINIWMAAITGIGGILGYLYGAWDGIIIALVLAIGIDYITGVIAAGIRGELSSKIGLMGLLKKAGIFLVVGLCGIMDRAVPGANGAVRQAACIFYMANEALSIIENAGSMGVPIPKALKRAVSSLRAEEE